MKELTLATTNSGKLEFFSHYLVKYENLEIKSLNDFSVDFEVEEPFETAEKNAKYKASVYSREFKTDVLAVDIALFVDEISEAEQPGVHARRIFDGKTRATDKEIYDYWHKQIVEKNLTGGKWHFAFAICTAEGKIIEFAYNREFAFKLVDNQPHYISGLPLSALCYNQKLGKFHAEMKREENLLAYSDLQEVFDKSIEEYLK